MVEPLSIAVAGVELVGPIFKLARLILLRTQAFRKAPALLQELHAFGQDLDQGQLALSVRYVEAYLRNSDGACRRDADGATLPDLARRHLALLWERLERTQPNPGKVR